MNGKALPTRSSQDLGYNGQGGYGGAQNGYGKENMSPTSYRSSKQYGRARGPELNGRTVLEGYRPDIMNGFEGEKPRYNPVSVSYRLSMLRRRSADKNS